MKNDWSIKYISWLAVVLFGINLWLKFPIERDLENAIFAAASSSVAWTAIIYGIFSRWAWKSLPFVTFVHGVPNLEGNWAGTYESTGNENTGGNPVEGKIEVQIRQPRLGSIKIRSKTHESDAESISEGFTTAEDGKITLHYTYRSEPHLQHYKRSPMSYGTTQLAFTKPDSLAGSYWTSRNTSGRLTLRKLK